MIVYISRTGNVKNIVERIDSNIPTLELTADLVVHEPYLLLTYTDNLGEAPKVVRDFLKNNTINQMNLKGVIASGNVNFGKIKDEYYCGSAIEISNAFKVPIIRKIDLRGNQSDIDEINKKYKEMIGESS